MIFVKNLSISFIGESLFENVSFIINDRDKIGLVGKNGSGKTTLLKIINGQTEADKGNIIISSDTKIGFLPQEMIINSNRTVIDETLEAFADIKIIQENIKKYSSEISLRTDIHSKEYLDIIDKLNDANAYFNIHGGQTIHAETERVLKGLGFQSEDFHKNIKNFSSGWQMRIELAKILLQKPDVLLLDEPTNHLDIESIQWFEDYLINFSGAVVLVSHDRAFLDNITKRTIEISLGKIYDYKANYSRYVELREERIEQQTASYNNQQKEIKDIEKFIERFRYKATKARQVQSRIRKLDKMDIFEIEEKDNASIHFLFPPAPHSGTVVAEAKCLSKNYAMKNVFQNVDFNILKGEKIAFVGKNGEGKTTMTKIITGNISYDGFFKTGHNVIIGYYAQNQSELLDYNKTVFETLDEIAYGDIRKNIKTILGSFLFSGDTVEKKVKVLSGGEKARLALAKLLLSPVNLLILDEPTNHLDMLSKDILKNALIRYNGTLIIVSHDRDFLQGLTDKIFEFRNNTIKEFIGDIYEFLEYRKLKSLNAFKNNPDKKVQNNINLKQLTDSKLERERKKQQEKELKKLQKEIINCEKEIAKKELSILDIEIKINNPEFYRNHSKSTEILKEYETFKKLLEYEMKHWELLIKEYEEKNINNQ